ncbi:hypothetical protein [Acidovorax sp. 106]|uniref:hypothetical protein n=1 Tax=Acidovorax sp. 106 TaxID=2135637 RepID=UPI0011C3F930|nr:hypothetical protein [Acidovorax sp. 106]
MKIAYDGSPPKRTAAGQNVPPECVNKDSLFVVTQGTLREGSTAAFHVEPCLALPCLAMPLMVRPMKKAQPPCEGLR